MCNVYRQTIVKFKVTASKQLPTFNGCTTLLNALFMLVIYYFIDKTQETQAEKDVWLWQQTFELVECETSLSLVV